MNVYILEIIETLPTKVLTANIKVSTSSRMFRSESVDEVPPFSAPSACASISKSRKANLFLPGKKLLSLNGIGNGSNADSVASS